MKRSRSDISTGASLFRELKLKRQRLSMLLNRDINDVLSSTSSSDTGDHGSDVDAGPPLMLREDSACFESRRHDAVDSGASSDGDWSFCGNGYSTRHPLMLIPDHTRLVSSHVGQSGLFSGHPSSGDRKTFAVGKPGLDAEPVSMTTRGVDFGQTNMSAALPPSCGSEFLCPPVNVSHDSCGSRPQTEVNSSALSRFKSGASIWLHHDTFRRRHNDDAEKHSHKVDDITSGLTFDPHSVKDNPEVEPAGGVGGYVQENGHVQESDHVRESNYGQMSDHIQVNDYVQATDPSTQDSNSGQMVSTALTSDDQSCALTDPGLCERSSHLETRSVIQHGSDLVVSVKLEEKLCDGQVPLTSGGLARGDKPVLDWTQLDQLKHTQETSYSPAKSDKADPDKQQLVCEICTDRASGLHYGIISCEGCKGFFKRTVQNKRVYSCIANGDCQVTKLRRNRCQYCRFKKCLLKGMVLAAVRDDRMPGGRNSGAVYSLYKVKYRKPGRTADASSRKTTARRLKAVGGGGSSSKHSRSLDQTDRTGHTLWLQQEVSQTRPDTHGDTYVCQRQPSAGFCGRLVHGADGITVSQDSADGIGVSHDRNMAADMSADMSRESVTMSRESVTVCDDTSMSGSRHFSVGLDRSLHQDSSSHDTYMNADNSNASQYSNINVDNPSVCYNRNIHADGAAVSRYENADSAPVSRYENADGAPVSRYENADGATVSRYENADGATVSRYENADGAPVSRYENADHPTVSRYLSADSPTVSRYLNADSSSVITCGVRYADGADMNRSRRSVIADSREMAQTEVIYDRVSVGETNDSRHSNNTGSRHSNHANMDDADRGHCGGGHLVHIEQLLRCEQTHDLAAATQPYSGVALSTLLRHLSDNVVRELVKWMKTLPFYDRLPMSVHRQCLAEKWYDLLLLTMLAHQACTGRPRDPRDDSADDVNSHVARNVLRLQHGLRHVLDHEMPVDELYREVGDIVQKLTDIVLNFRRLGLTREEYVCLKVILLLTHDSATEANETTDHIHGVYRDVLRQLVADTFPHEPTRFTELLLQLPHIQTASSLLMKTNTIYIPSMLNAPLQ